MRVVSADHVLFDECVLAFRTEEAINAQLRQVLASQSRAVVMTDFILTKPWDLGICTLEVSRRVELPGGMASFVSTVRAAPESPQVNSNLFCHALAAIISFISGRRCTSIRDGYAYGYGCMELRAEQYMKIALQFPILISGPGSTNPCMSEVRQSQLEMRIREIVCCLYGLKYSKFLECMRIIRLVQLSVNSKRDDFGLSYYLIVSAIEAAAQAATNRKKFVRRHPAYEAWKANRDSEFEKLFAEYCKAASREYLSERFIFFIKQYASVNEWNDIVRRNGQDSEDDISQSLFAVGVNILSCAKYIDSEQLEKMTEAELERLIGDVYKYRSLFVHVGQQPPHKFPDSDDRFFANVSEGINNDKLTTLLTYQALIGVGSASILRWMMGMVLP